MTTGVSKGKVAGAIKRHGYSRGRKLTVTLPEERALSGCTDPGKVFKGRNLQGIWEQKGLQFKS